VLVVAPLVTECVDTSPLAYVPEKNDGGLVADGGADSALIRSCRQCISGEGEPCRSQFDVCASLEKCVPILDCVLDNGCFKFSELGQRFECGSPCLSAHGVMAGNDPVVTALGQINVCVVNSCSDACFMK
jgi:hypothetical protein